MIENRFAFYVILAIVLGGAVFIALATTSATALEAPNRNPDVFWRVETVDSGSFGATALALDQAGDVHLLAQRFDGLLEYFVRDAGGWHLYNLISGVSDQSVNLTLDGNDEKHIGYAANGEVQYARTVGGNWSFETVEAGDYPSLVIEESGDAHISFTYEAPAFPPRKLKYARRDGNGWSTEFVPGGVDVGAQSSLAIDENGFPHILFNGLALYYAYQDGGGWHMETVDDENCFCAIENRSLALEGNDDAKVSYVGFNNGQPALFVANRDSGGWHVTLVDPDVGGNANALVLDGTGNARIVYTYEMEPQGVLKCAFEDNSGWQIESVDQGNTWDGVDNTAIVLGSDDVIHAAYVVADYAGTELRYARRLDLPLSLFLPAVTG